MIKELRQPPEITKYERVSKRIDWNCDWYYDEVSLQEMRNELDRLEALGVTHIEFDYDVKYGDFDYNFKALQIRPETDEEFESRKKALLERREFERQKDLKRLAELKAKYED